tara:strand:- start:1054 stop:1269 length:216 start_codon:yes stop_codon:yes gene_type:complete
MAVNINETIKNIKAAGSSNVRSVPMEGANVQSGKYQIEIKDNGNWVPIAECPNKKMADDIISQAVTNLILG